MQIRIPRIMVRASDAFGDWANAPIWRRGRLELRRIDLMTAAGFVFCCAWYTWTSGWMGALEGGALYIALAAMSLWMF